MSPFHLRNRPAVKKRFIELIVNHIKFVDSFSDPFITHEFLRMYHRKKSVNAALNGFVDDVIKILKRDGIDRQVSTSKDFQKVADSRSDLQETTDETVLNLLDQKVREPRRLVFYTQVLFLRLL